VKKERVINDILLIVTAGIWGLAFTAQRAGMEFLGPFWYNGIRFALGAVSLVPFLVFRKKAGVLDSVRAHPWIGVTAGLFLFTASTFQQVGLLYTTAGKAGFITGLYVVLVPVIGSFLGTTTDSGRWTGALFATAGLYLLSVTEGFSIGAGDALVLGSAVFYAGHVLLLGRYAPRIDTLGLAVFQYLTCSVLSVVGGVVFETVSLQGVLSGWIPVVYGGVFSVGVAYSLQVVAQKKAHPSHAAIILSLEGAFAAVGGFLILGEILSTRDLIGCLLMFMGMIVSQISFFGKRRQKASL
jgi:drug/metabolite transporter (DMT)-like permease